MSNETERLEWWDGSVWQVIEDTLSDAKDIAESVYDLYKQL